MRSLIREIIEEQRVFQPPPLQPRDLPPPVQQAPQVPATDTIVAQLVAQLQLACTPPPVPESGPDTTPSRLQPPTGFAEPEAAVVVPPEQAQLIQFLRRNGMAIPDNRKPSLAQSGLRSTRCNAASTTHNAADSSVPRKKNKKRKRKPKQKPKQPKTGEASKGGHKRTWGGGDGGAGGQNGNSSTFNPQN